MSSRFKVKNSVWIYASVKSIQRENNFWPGYRAVGSSLIGDLREIRMAYLNSCDSEILINKTELGFKIHTSTYFFEGFWR